MGKKKRGHPDLEEILGRPWCYYCERDFDDLKILISHQKAKHFKCDRCGRRLNTAGGLSVHLNQVHKETLASVENALPNRSNLDVEIFGMEGIPDDVVQAHNQRVISQFQQADVERRAQTGNHGPGGGSAPKKPKFESPADLKKRLAEHKAKMAEERLAAAGGNAHNGFAQDRQSPSLGQSPGPYAASPPFGQAYPPGPSPFPQTYGGPQSNMPQVQQAYQPQSFPPPAQGFPSPQNGQLQPSRTLTPSAGLPQRPTFNAPSVNHHQMQQIHQGQGQHIQLETGAPLNQNIPDMQKTQPPPSSNATSLDDLVSGASKAAESAATAEEPKKAKKEKGMKLIYSDTEISPEEKRAIFARGGVYALTFMST